MMIEPGYCSVLVVIDIFGAFGCQSRFVTKAELKQDYPLNLSILLSGGKENNYDSLSSGE